MYYRRLFKLMVLLFFVHFSTAQVYLGTGVTRSFAHKFNGGDRNYSYANAQNYPVTPSWIKDKAYNFFTLFAGIKIKNKNQYHDIRITATNKGAISILDKQDFLLDPIIIELRAQKVLGSGTSRYVALGVNNRIIGLRYGYGININPYLSFCLYAQADVVYKKLINVNWYSDLNDNIYTSKNKYIYRLNSFRDDSPLFNKISNINAEIGINALVQLGRYFALNLEIGHNFLPAVHKGAKPSNDKFVYWENDAYFTSMQLGILAYFASDNSK